MGTQSPLAEVIHIIGIYLITFDFVTAVNGTLLLKGSSSLCKTDLSSGQSLSL